ncbi:hypothetical protein [Streptomyces sp. JNUCC 63]
MIDAARRIGAVRRQVGRRAFKGGEFGPGAAGAGWDTMLMGLAGHLPSGAAVDPAGAMA